MQHRRTPQPVHNDQPIGGNQPWPSGLHRTKIEPWTGPVQRWLDKAGATAAESSAVLHDLVEAHAIPPTEERALAQLATVRKNVRAYLEQREGSSKHAELGEERRRLDAEARARERSDELLRAQEQERDEKQREEAEQIEAARLHAISEARIKAGGIRTELDPELDAELDAELDDDGT